MAAALACGAFTFLLGGGPVEMLFAFIAAGIGNFIRTRMIKHHYTLFLNIAVSVSAACLIYAICLNLAESLLHISAAHEAGYICSMLFIIPGFPFITSGIDLAKLDLRSGLERLTYALIIILVATMGAWITAMILKLQPEDFIAVHLGTASRLIFRLCASFCGVLGFSIMFNSSIPMASTAAMIGAVANTLRLSLVDFTGMPAAVACDQSLSAFPGYSFQKLLGKFYIQMMIFGIFGKTSCCFRMAIRIRNVRFNIENRCSIHQICTFYIKYRAVRLIQSYFLKLHTG